MFFQPGAVFPWMEAYQPLRNFAIIALITYILAGNKNKVPFLSVKINRYFVLFVILQILSSSKLWMSAGIETLNLWIRLGLVYFLIFKSVTDINKIKWVGFMIILGSGYLSYYSILTFVIHYMPGARANGFGWYENSNDLSMILVAIIPLLLLLVNTSRNLVLKYLFLGIAGLFSFNILFTSSRNGLLGLCSVGVLCLLVSKKIAKPVRLVLLVILFASVVGVGVANVLSRSDLSGLTGDDSSESRKEQWKAGIRMTLANPLFGVGRGEFRYRAIDYQGIKGMEPHNTIIQVFGETGIPGGIFYILFAIFPIFEGFKLLRRIETDKLETEGFIAYKFLLIALTGFWVCAFFSNRYHAYILYVVVALIAAVKENIIYNQLGSKYLNIKGTIKESVKR